MCRYRKVSWISALLFCLVLLVGSCAADVDGPSTVESRSSSDVGESGTPASDSGAESGGGDASAHAETFAIGMSDGEPVILVADGSMLPLEYQGEAFHVRSVDWLPDKSAIALGRDSIARLNSEGVQNLISCEGCLGIAIVDGLAVTAQTSYVPGVDFEILRFDLDLNPVDRLPARHASSRTEVVDVSGGRDAEVWAASPGGGTVITYLASDGVMRGGPTTVALYDDAGDLMDSVEVRGRIDRLIRDPEGDALAFVGWASGGACHTEDYLTVILERGEQHLLSIEFGDLVRENLEYMQILDLWWEGSTLNGLAHMFPTAGADGTCGETPTLTGLTYDLESNSASLAPSEGGLMFRGHLGAQCDVEVWEEFGEELVLLGDDLVDAVTLHAWPDRRVCPS